MNGKTVCIEDDLPFAIPDNWAWCRLSEISYPVGMRQNQVQTKSILQKGLFPVVSQGATFIDGYCTDESLVVRNTPAIMFGDHTRNVKFVDFPFVIGADGTKFFKALCNPKYLFYCVLFTAERIKDRGYRRHWGLLNAEYFPLSPLKEQQRITAQIELITESLKDLA